MKRRFTFDDAQKFIKDTGTPVHFDFNDQSTLFWLKELGFIDQEAQETSSVILSDIHKIR